MVSYDDRDEFVGNLGFVAANKRGQIDMFYVNGLNQIKLDIEKILNKRF